MILYGMGFSFLFPAMTALIIDHTNQVDRGKGFGLFYAFFSLGVVLGPLYIGFWDITPDLGLKIGSLTVICIVMLVFISQFIRFTKEETSES